jgi:peroxiredoxin
MQRIARSASAAGRGAAKSWALRARMSGAPSSVPMGMQLYVRDAKDGKATTDELFKGKRALVVGYVGAFTGTWWARARARGRPRAAPPAPGRAPPPRARARAIVSPCVHSPVRAPVSRRSQKQLPGFAEKAGEIKKKGIDSIVAVAVNDPVVIKAFGEAAKLPSDKLTLVADFDARFTKALGLNVDLSVVGLGERSTRALARPRPPAPSGVSPPPRAHARAGYAMVVENGKVVKFAKEAKPGELVVSSADAVLKNML